jgi:hypothetical protein
MEELSKYQDTIDKMLQQEKTDNTELITQLETRISTNDDRAFSGMQQTEKDMNAATKKLQTQIKQIFADASVFENKVKKLEEKKPAPAGMGRSEVEELVNAVQGDLFDSMLELKEKIADLMDEE